MGKTRKLTGTVTVLDDDDQPQTFGPGDDVPEWASKKITNPAAWEADDDQPAGPLVSGAGSGRDEVESDLAARQIGEAGPGVAEGTAGDGDADSAGDSAGSRGRRTRNS